MKTKIFGLVLILSLTAVLGACESGSEPGGTTATPAAPGEPADTGSTPAATTRPAVTPSATPTKSP